MRAALARRTSGADQTSHVAFELVVHRGSARVEVRTPRPGGASRAGKSSHRRYKTATVPSLKRSPASWHLLSVSVSAPAAPEGGGRKNMAAASPARLPGKAAASKARGPDDVLARIYVDGVQVGEGVVPFPPSSSHSSGALVPQLQLAGAGGPLDVATARVFMDPLSSDQAQYLFALGPDHRGSLDAPKSLPSFQQTHASLMAALRRAGDTDLQRALIFVHDARNGIVAKSLAVRTGGSIRAKKLSRADMAATPEPPGPPALVRSASGAVGHEKLLSTRVVDAESDVPTILIPVKTTLDQADPGDVRLSYVLPVQDALTRVGGVGAIVFMLARVPDGARQSALLRVLCRLLWNNTRNCHDFSLIDGYALVARLMRKASWVADGAFVATLFHCAGIRETEGLFSSGRVSNGEVLQHWLLDWEIVGRLETSDLDVLISSLVALCARSHPHSEYHRRLFRDIGIVRRIVGGLRDGALADTRVVASAIEVLKRAQGDMPTDDDLRHLVGLAAGPSKGAGAAVGATVLRHILSSMHLAPWPVDVALSFDAACPLDVVLALVKRAERDCRVLWLELLLFSLKHSVELEQQFKARRGFSLLAVQLAGLIDADADAENAAGRVRDVLLHFLCGSDGVVSWFRPEVVETLLAAPEAASPVALSRIREAIEREDSQTRVAGLCDRGLIRRVCRAMAVASEAQAIEAESACVELLVAVYWVDRGLLREMVDVYVGVGGPRRGLRLLFMGVILQADVAGSGVWSDEFMLALRELLVWLTEDAADHDSEAATDPATDEFLHFVMHRISASPKLLGINQVFLRRVVLLSLRDLRLHPKRVSMIVDLLSGQRALFETVAGVPAFVWRSQLLMACPDKDLARGIEALWRRVLPGRIEFLEAWREEKHRTALAAASKAIGALDARELGMAAKRQSASAGLAEREQSALWLFGSGSLRRSSAKAKATADSALAAEQKQSLTSFEELFSANNLGQQTRLEEDEARVQDSIVSDTIELAARRSAAEAASAATEQEAERKAGMAARELVNTYFAYGQALLPEELELERFSQERDESLSTLWKRLFKRMTHERSLFAPVVAPPAGHERVHWKLDKTEGPMRVRIRLKRSRLPYTKYPYYSVAGLGSRNVTPPRGDLSAPALDDVLAAALAIDKLPETPKPRARILSDGVSRRSDLDASPAKFSVAEGTAARDRQEQAKSTARLMARLGFELNDDGSVGARAGDDAAGEADAEAAKAGETPASSTTTANLVPGDRIVHVTPAWRLSPFRKQQGELVLGETHAYCRLRSSMRAPTSTDTRPANDEPCRLALFGVQGSSTAIRVFFETVD